MITVDGYLIDAAETEGHSFESDVAEDEVEVGSAFTDSIKNKSDKVSIKGIVSDTPVGDFVQIRAQAAAAGLDSSLPFLPSDEAQAKLIKVHRDEKPVTIQTSRGTWESMALVRLDIDVDDKTGKSLRFAAQFQTIRLRSTSLVIVKVAAPQLQSQTKFSREAFDKEFFKDGKILVRSKDGDPTVKNTATWNVDKGAYEYSDGTTVREEDYVPPPGAIRDPLSGQWENPDGSDFSSAQYDKVTPHVDEVKDKVPWYAPATQALGRIF